MLDMIQRVKGTQTRAVETRANILQAVDSLWDGRAFDDITIADIAQAAGVAKGTVLAHFSEKRSILAAFLADMLDVTCQRLNESSGFAASPARLSDALAPLIGYLLADRALLRLLTLDGDAAQCAALLDPALLRLRGVLRQGFADAGQNDPDLAADVFIPLVVHVVVTAHSPDTAHATGELERLSQILFQR